jgi:hypothetical protein
MRRLGLVLATDPARDDLGLLAPLATTACEQGLRVELFIMSAAVASLDDARLAELAALGCEIRVCASSAHALGQAIPSGITEASQDDHAALLARSDRVLAFT